MNGHMMDSLGFLLLFWTVVWMTESVTVYKLLAGYNIIYPVLGNRTCGKFCRRTCIQACDCKAGCKSVSVSQPLKACQLHQNYIYDEDTEFVADSNWEYHQIATDTVKKGDWTLVFRITPSSGQGALTRWNDNGNYDDHPANRDGVPPGCATTNSSKSCDRNFRSKILDDWESYNIQQVKLEVFKNDVSAQNIVFDGTGTDVYSWMSPAKIINSTWSDLASSSHNYFSITGHDLIRTFFINNVYTNYELCSGDHGWLVVVEVAGGLGCDWESQATTIPTIFYSSESGVVSNAAFDVADVLAVFVKLG